MLHTLSNFVILYCVVSQQLQPHKIGKGNWSFQNQHIQLYFIYSDTYSLTGLVIFCLC